MTKMAKKTTKNNDTELKTIADLRSDDRNANKGSEAGSKLIAQSIKDLGAGRSVLADKHGTLIAGNKTVEGAKSAGVKKIRVVQTRGDELVVVQRMDLDLEKDAAARELAIVDNRAGQISLSWDAEQLEALAKDYKLDLGKLGISDEELAAMAGKPAGEASESVSETIDEKYEVVVECASETEQKDVFDKLTLEGLVCRVLTI